MMSRLIHCIDVKYHPADDHHPGYQSNVVFELYPQDQGKLTEDELNYLKQTFNVITLFDVFFHSPAILVIDTFNREKPYSRDNCCIREFKYYSYNENSYKDKEKLSIHDSIAGSVMLDRLSNVFGLNRIPSERE